MAEGFASFRLARGGDRRAFAAAAHSPPMRKPSAYVSGHRRRAVGPVNDALTRSPGNPRVSHLVAGRCGRITRGRIIVVDDAFVAVLFAGIAGYRIAWRRIVVVHDPLIGILFVAGCSGVLRTVIGACRKGRTLVSRRIVAALVMNVRFIDGLLFTFASSADTLSLRPLQSTPMQNTAARIRRHVPCQMVNSKRGWRFLRNAVRRRTNRSRTLCRACVRFKSLKRELTAAPGFWE
jgi:hypothetical protein